MLHVLHLAATEREQARTHAREHRVLPRRGAARSPVAAGHVLGGRYRVTGVLGQGGMGTVLRAHDLVLDHAVALKLVAGDDADLREEVRLAQQVTHPNVCRTYDLEELDGRHFVKMECICGDTLADVLAQRRTLPVARAVAIARAIADGLAAAHARGIVHRDLKPGNVMISGDRVVLMDFGLAQREGASDGAGTPAYMSPEQLAGAPLDARSDLFALGCVVFEMVTGMPPFGDGAIGDVARRQLAPPAAVLGAGVPRQLATAIGALLARDPARRSRGLALLRGQRRRPRWVAPLAAIGLAAAAATWAARAPAWEPVIADLPQFEENADDPSFSPDGRSYLFSSDRGHRDVWAVYVATVAGGEPRQVSPAGELCVGARWMRDGRAVAMSCYVGRERRIVRAPVAGGPTVDLGPGWTVDDCGDALAVVVARPTGAAIVLRDRAGRDRELATLSGVELARCDARGERIVYIESPIAHPGFPGGLAVVDRRGDVQRIAGVADADSATFTPDGRSIVFSRLRAGTSSLYEIGVDGSGLRALAPHELYATSPDVAPDGRSLLFDRDRTAIPLFELGPGGAVQKTFRFERLTRVLAAPGGRMLVATQHDSEPEIVAIDATTFDERAVAPGEALAIAGTTVVFRANDDPHRLDAVALAGGAPSTLATLPARLLAAAAGPDGIHVELDRGGASEAWLVGKTGGIAPEGVAGLVMPAPAGGWRVVRVSDGFGVVLRFVAPGHALTDAAFERAATWGEPAWVGDRELAYCDVNACRRVDVTTGRDVATVAIDRPGDRPITVGSDGARWFATSYVGHVTRHLITNFADRPR